MPFERLAGRGVMVSKFTPDIPLRNAGLLEGVTLLHANGRKVSSPDDLVNEIEANGRAEIRFYRAGDYWQIDLEDHQLLAGRTASQKLGIVDRSTSRSWRSSGFLGHYSTYAEILQLVGSLGFAMAVAGFWRSRRLKLLGARGSDDEHDAREENEVRLRIRVPPLILSVCVLLIGVALLMTLTGAPQAGLVLSGFVIVVLGSSRKALLLHIALSIPVGAAAVIYLQKTRSV